MTCPAKYEPDAKNAQTHTCDLNDDHGGLHHCPRCGLVWDTVNL